MDSRFVDTISGRGIPLRGRDIDTDRIIPARFLKSVSFEGLETHAFEDDRRQLEERGQMHPFSNPRYGGAAVLVVNGNFGCGSSREHAPQALQRWGIRAVVGESFSEIFFGNSVALGMPCLTVSAQDAEALLSAIEHDPLTELMVSVSGQSVAVNGTIYQAAIPAGAREAFTAGTWDATGLLMDDFDRVREVAKNLPYVSGFFSFIF
jgi:3-isopropylmalate/(R)-2-methylmalate dehydratase small subunit